MRLRHLEVIWVLGRSGSMRQAARTLGVSQPAVSQTLKHAEDLLGYELFRRERGRLMPTPELRMLMPQMERIFTEVEHVRVQSLNMGREVDREIKVWAIPALTGDWLARATKRFRRHNPRSVVRIVSATARGVIDAVMGHEAEIGLVHGPLGIAGLDHTSLGRNDIVAVMHRDHPLGHRKAVTVRDLALFEVICLSGNNLPGDLTARAFRKANLQLPVVAELTSSASAIIFAREGVGVALVDSRTALTFRLDEVIALPFLPRLELEAHAVVASDRQLARQTHAFLRALCEVAAETTPAATRLPG